MDYTTSLNPQQLEAVTAPAGPTLVLAGPGSGKTRVLTKRLAHMISQGVLPTSIMAVTFTNKAASEMRRRVETQLHGGIRGLTIGTFHATCARILRREAERLPVTGDFVIYDRGDQIALIKQAMVSLEISEKQFRPERIHSVISNSKNDLIGPDAFHNDTYFREIVARVYDQYQRLLHENNALDFDDLLLGVVEIFRDYPEVASRYRRLYEHVMVDEFQDTNIAQYELLRQLTSSHNQLYVVADPDQSIYRWRGADYRNVERFQDDHPDAQVYKLEHNYRSTQAILDAAIAVIDRNTGRTPKKLVSDRQGGARIQLHESYDRNDEAQYVVDSIALLTHEGDHHAGDCAIMYRTNAQSRALEEAFIHAGLPYRLVGATRFYARREIKDMLAFLRVVHNPRDTVSLFRIINVPPRGIGTRTLRMLQAESVNMSATPADILTDLSQRGEDSPYYQRIGGRAAKPLTAFGNILGQWMAEKDLVTVAQIVDMIIAASGYEEYVRDGSEQGEERWNNVMELHTTASEFDNLGLTTFLEEAALVSEIDNLGDEDGTLNVPTLLTLHAAKGLEFPIVFIIGMEDGVLPHQRSLDDDEEIAEERRLFYVGLTRARDRVILTYSFRGNEHGGRSFGSPSRFLVDIPKHLLSGDVRNIGGSEAPNLGSGWLLDNNPRDPSMSRSEIIPDLQFHIGQRVAHSEFGEGVVLESEAVGGDEMVTVAFAGGTIKRLMAEMANLTTRPG